MSGAVVALLGPSGAGKSSVGRHLSRRLGWPQRSVDASCWGHYRELPEVAAAERALAERHGPDAVEDRDRRRYLTRLSRLVGEGEAGWLALSERMRLHAVVRALSDVGPAVVDLGAGHSRISEPGRRAALEAALAACRLAVWLQPWPSPAESAAALAGRLRLVGRAFDPAELRGACEPAARPGAVEVLFTGDREPDAVAAELHARLRSPR